MPASDSSAQRSPRPASTAPLSSLRAALAEHDPARVALADGTERIGYGALVRVLDAAAAAPAPAPARVEVAVGGAAGDVVRLLAEACRERSVLVLADDMTAWERRRAGALFAAAARRTPVDPPEPVLGLCSSGTGGRPRVVELDWDSVLSNAGAFSCAARYVAGDTIWCTTPAAHLYGLGAGVLAGLLAGSTVLLRSGAVGPGELGELLLGERVTVVLSVPFLLRRYVAELERAPALTRDWRVRCGIASGERVEEALVGRWREVAGVPLLVHYGLTEAGHVTLGRGQPGEGVGRPLPGVEVRTADDGGIAVRRRRPGRPYRPLGDAPPPEAWCETGDLGRLDAHGALHLDGRRDVRIAVAGRKVDPVEVELALRACAHVHDCAVVGADGEQVVALVVAAPQLDEQRLRTDLRARLSAYKIPRRLVRVEAIPRTATGKLLRARLAALLDGAAPVDEAPAR